MMTDMLHKNTGDALNLAREFTTLTHLKLKTKK